MPREKKILLGIHKLMSQYVQGRTSKQCRSHHQKMMHKYKNIDNIILQYHQAFPAEIKAQTAEALLESKSDHQKEQITL